MVTATSRYVNESSTRSRGSVRFSLKDARLGFFANSDVRRLPPAPDLKREFLAPRHRPSHPPKGAPQDAQEGVRRVRAARPIKAWETQLPTDPASGVQRLHSGHGPPLVPRCGVEGETLGSTPSARVFERKCGGYASESLTVGAGAKSNGVMSARWRAAHPLRARRRWRADGPQAGLVRLACREPASYNNMVGASGRLRRPPEHTARRLWCRVDRGDEV